MLELRLVEHARVVRAASLGVALCLSLSAQTLLNTKMLSGSGTDTPAAIATDSQGNVYIAGQTNSPDFPVTNALFPQLPEPALRVSSDGRTFAAAGLSVIQVNSVAASADGSLVLAATNSGLYRSANGGAAWAATSLTGQILAVAVDPVNSGNAYAVGISGPVQGPTWNIYKSGDSGMTWQSVFAFSQSPGTAPVSRIIINPLNPSIIYAYVNSALMQSTDAGTTWQPITIPAAQSPTAGQTSPTGFAIAPSQPNIAYATTFYTPLMKSTDGGATWQPEAPIGSAGPNAIAVDPQNPATVWLVNGAGIQRSTDGGVTFQKVAAMGDGSWKSIAVVNSSEVFASDQHNVYATFDGGATWTTVTSGQINSVVATGGRIYAAGSAAGAVFLAKLDPTLTQVLYSTFLASGGVNRIAVDSSGNVFLAGTTQSHAFPTTPGALGRDFASSFAGFVMKIRADGGALLYSTLLDALQPNGLAVDAAGDAVIVGAASAGAIPATVPGPCTRTLSSTDLPGSAVQTPNHAFVAKLSPDASAFLYEIYLTGSCGDVANDVTLDSTGAWIGGTTYSLDFPITPDAMVTSFPTHYNAGFVSRLSADGSKVLYSSFVGGGVEGTVNALTLGPQGDVIAAGESTVQATPGAYQSAVGGCPPVFGFFSVYQPNDHGFVMKFSPTSPAPFFTAVIGGECLDYVSRLSLDSAGDIWATGGTSSSNFPTIAPLAGLGAPGSGFLAALDSSGANLFSSTMTQSPGFVTAGPGGMVYFAGSAGSHVLIARIDANQRAPILLDSIAYFGLGPGPANTFPGAPPSPLSSVAPGQAVRLKGRGIGPADKVDAASAPAHVLPTLAGVQVTFNGITAPLISVQATEIDCIAPFELDGATSATVQVTYSGLGANPFSVPVVPQNLDIFAVANQDGTPNSESNPAPIDGIATLYLTGAGQTNPPSTDGTLNTTPLLSPQSFPTVTLNTFAQQPIFVGAAVGQPAGVTQVNLFLPDPGAGNVDVVRIANTSAWIYVKRP